MQLSVADIITDFADFRVAAVVARDLSILEVRSRELDEMLASAENSCRARWGGTDLSEIPGIAVWRRAYRAFGVKRTSYRCSVERIVKNVLAERRVPAINNFVDAYNLISLTHLMPLGADDLARVAGNVAFRYSRPGDSFFDMSAEDGGGSVNDPPKEGEVVYADSEKVLCRRWNWRQDARSLVTPETRAAIVTVQSNGVGDLDAAVADLLDLIARFAGGAATMAIADRDNPVVEIG